MNPLQRLGACGQAVWLDYLKRSFIAQGELRELIENDGLKGVTSNPSIFEKAIGESDEYACAIEACLRRRTLGVEAIYEQLAIADIGAAADELRPVFERTQGRDGYVSLECSPYLADDSEASVKEALRLWAAVGRPNLMIKVPATPAGVAAIEILIGRGVNVNVTLLLSVDVYERVVEAYLSGLDLYRRAGGDVAKIASVASFFVSRIDTAVDDRLEGLGDREAADRLRGGTAIANAKIAFARYRSLFAGPRWRALEDLGAKTQRLLWASTSAKNPAFKDTLYVEALIGRDTVNTMPRETLDAFRDHGEVSADSVEQDLEGAQRSLTELERQGISLNEVTEKLLQDGVRQFSAAFDQLFEILARRREELLAGDRRKLEPQGRSERR
jgi:transaldolase / glucose-6-phosphate isomerase